MDIERRGTLQRPNESRGSFPEGAAVTPSGVAVSPAAAHGVLAEGSRFGGYVIGDCIGSGGMARVYRAEHLGLRRPVALKVLTSELAEGTEGRARFTREARLAASVKHPSVVEIYDIGVHDGIPYLVMELLEGLDLEAFLCGGGARDETTIVELLVPIVAGLVAVHEAGIVHRDLKPGNIFLARQASGALQPKLLDFGISKSMDRMQQHLTALTKNGLIGTPLYMSPEAMLGQQVTPSADQYSLGVVLYECTSGVNPFAGGNFAETVRRVTSGDHVPLGARQPRPSRRLGDIITRAMNVDPERRFPSMRAFGRALLPFAGERVRVTWADSFRESSLALRAREAAASAAAAALGATLGGSRRGTLAAAAAAALLVGGALFGGPWLFGPREPGSGRAPITSAAALKPAPDTGAAPPQREVTPTTDPQHDHSLEAQRDPTADTRRDPTTDTRRDPTADTRRDLTADARGDHAAGAQHDPTAEPRTDTLPHADSPPATSALAQPPKASERSETAEKPARARRGSRSGAKKARTRRSRRKSKPAAAPQTKTAQSPGESDTPEWLQPTRRPPPVPTEMGTNEAPILD